MPELPVSPALGTHPRLRRLQAGIEALLIRLRPYLWVWPPIAFGAGVLSFFLVDRQQWLGGVLALGMLLAWGLLLGEGLIGRWLARRGYPTLPRGVTAFIAQLIHQETLFFCLPFLLVTTVWTSGQALFTLLLIGLGLLSIIDPLYYRLAGRLRWLYFAFHAQCVFVVVLVTLPLLLSLTTAESLGYALLAMVVFALPSLTHLLQPKGWRSWLALLGVALVLAGVAWSGRAWVPTAHLWLTDSALAPALDRDSRTPVGELDLTPGALARTGLYAYTAIRAPRGLEETIYHEWRHQGELLDRIPLRVRGGRKAGYRAWSHKLNFPESSGGDWRIDIVTGSGQRLGSLRFRVDETGGERADDEIRLTTDIPGLEWRRMLPGGARD